VEFLHDWVETGAPNAFWVSGFFFPQGFNTAVMQKYARKTQIAIDTLRFRTEVTAYETREDIPEGQRPEKGEYMYGHFLQGARWDRENKVLSESNPGELFTAMPVIWLDPETNDTPVTADVYNCPCYKTSSRRGVLSTTGHSTNFVQYVQLSSDKSEDHYIRRGAALLLALDEQ
jgi:dynein heavy chain